MAESLINTKRRISTIDSTKKITKAMKLVASVKFQRWKRFYQNSIPFRDGMYTTMVRSTIGCSFDDLKNSRCLMSFPTEKNLYIVVTSTLGLCGAYNYNLYKEFDPLLKPKDELLFIGQKGFIRYHQRGNVTYDNFVNMLDKDFAFSKARRLRHVILQLHMKNHYQGIYLVYTKYKNSLTFLPTIEKLVPFDTQAIEKEQENFKQFDPVQVDSNRNELVGNLLPHYLDALLYNHLLEAEVCELSSRRNAMESATDAADKITKKLRITYNKTRQNQITQEITEVVAGANAGKNDDE